MKKTFTTKIKQLSCNTNNFDKKDKTICRKIFNINLFGSSIITVLKEQTQMENDLFESQKNLSQKNTSAKTKTC